MHRCLIRRLANFLLVERAAALLKPCPTSRNDLSSKPWGRREAFERLHRKASISAAFRVRGGGVLHMTTPTATVWFKIDVSYQLKTIDYDVNTPPLQSTI